MGMLKRWRQRMVTTTRSSGDDVQPEQLSFSAAIPAGRHGALCRVDVQWVREPQQDGDRLRLRAHIQTNLASVLRPALLQARQGPSASALPPPLAGDDSRPVRRVAEQAGRITARGLQQLMRLPLAQRWAEPLLRHDFNTWVEIQASTEPLDGGALDLVPARDQLAALGIRPRRQGPGVVAESWRGDTPAGHAQLSLVQIDKADLPPELSRKLGPQPFQLAAAIVNTMDRK